MARMDIVIVNRSGTLSLLTRGDESSLNAMTVTASPLHPLIPRKLSGFAASYLA